MPPSMSQSTRTTERRAASDQARLVAHEVEVWPARVVQTPKSKLTVLSRVRRALRTARHKENGSPCRHSRATVRFVRQEP